MITIIKYDKFATNTHKMDQFYQIDDVMSNMNLIITIVKVTVTTAHHIRILIAICVILSKTSFIFAHGTFILVFKFIINHPFCLTKNNANNFKVFVSAINVIITIILQIAHMDIILIIMVIANVIAIYQLDTKRNNLCKDNKSRNTWCIPTRNKTIAIIMLNFNNFSINIYQMNYFYAYITIIIEINIIINTIDALVVTFVIIQKIFLFAIDIIYSILQILILKFDYIMHAYSRYSDYSFYYVGCNQCYLEYSDWIQAPVLLAR